MLCLSVQAQENDTPTLDTEALEEALDSLEEGDTVPVPVEMLRTSLWYYENYWIEKDRADDLEESRNEWRTRAEERREANIEAARKAVIWKGIAIGSVSATISFLVLSLGVQ